MKRDIMNELQRITEQNLADIEQAKAEGRSAIGFYCLYSPTEIAVAADAIPSSKSPFARMFAQRGTMWIGT